MYAKARRILVRLLNQYWAKGNIAKGIIIFNRKGR